jgi:hypothetical protein
MGQGARCFLAVESQDGFFHIAGRNVALETMKPVSIICGLLLVAAVGCQKPDPVVVDQDDGTERLVEVTPIAAPDSDQTVSSVDSSGVPPHDAASFAAFLLVTKVEFDAGAAGTHTESFSTVYFADRARPLMFNGKTLGYFGLDLSPAITINDLPMFRLPHRVRVPGFLRDTLFGYFYAKDLAGLHQPNATFTWRVPITAVVGAFNVSITTPDNLQILAPAGGSVLPRNRDLLLQWTGKGDLNVVISVMHPVSKRTRPIMKLHPRFNTGRAIIDQKVLQLLPPDRYFVFTFVIANRYERLLVPPYQWTILVHAASVHNSYVEFQ